ncbi:hypothetical protein GGR57DRAFT_19741 [Xylariaceae sp. FL1272]|nr:hypothetical protein GGR57DRAFT_19741 [Xylariaceae sp. FL1272]
MPRSSRLHKTSAMRSVRYMVLLLAPASALFITKLSRALLQVEETASEKAIEVETSFRSLSLIDYLITRPLPSPIPYCLFVSDMQLADWAALWLLPEWAFTWVISSSRAIDTWPL